MTRLFEHFIDQAIVAERARIKKDSITRITADARAEKAALNKLITYKETLANAELYKIIYNADFDGLLSNSSPVIQTILHDYSVCYDFNADGFIEVKVTYYNQDMQNIFNIFITLRPHFLDEYSSIVNVQQADTNSFSYYRDSIAKYLEGEF